MILFLFILWYVTLIVSCLFPPLFLLTAIPLFLTAKGVHDAIKGERAEDRRREAWLEQEAEYRNARQTRAWLR